MNERNWGGRRLGAGRKATGRTKEQVMLTLSKHAAHELKERAQSCRLSVSDFVVKYLCLDTLPDNLTGGKRLTDGII